MKLRFFAVFVFSIMAIHASAQEYRIQAGDLLRIEVLEDPTINREVLVAPDGRITVPLAGSVAVSGARLPEAARRVTSGLEGSFAKVPTVVVSLLQARAPDAPLPADPTMIYVLGEVNKPGAVEIEDGLTLLQTIALAGGVTDFAATKRIQLRRVVNGSETVYGLNFKAVLDGESGLGLTGMQKGDVIVVPPRRLFE